MKKVIRYTRSILSVILGYLILAFASMAFVVVWYVEAWFALGSFTILPISIAYTFVTTFLAGFVTAWVAPGNKRIHAIIVVLLMAIVTVASVVIDVSVEPLSYKVLYLSCLVPGTIYGSHIQETRSSRVLHSD